MSKILSQEEIDALLASAVRTEAAPRGEQVPPAGGVVPYNFRRPDRVTKEQLRSLQFLHDRFARNVGTSLSAYLRAVTDVSINSVEQFTYAEFLMSLPDPTAFYSVAMTPLEGLAALELNPNVAFAMVDRMLGGSGRGVVMSRALTEIEQNVIDGVVKLILEHLTETWRGVVDVRFRVSGRETRPQMLQVAAPSEVVVLLAFDIRLGDARGMLHITVPAGALDAAGARFTQTWQRARQEPSPQDRRHLLGQLARVHLPVAATLDTTLRVRELLALRRGDVLSLGRAARTPLDVRVGGTTKFHGTLVAHGRTGGVRLEATAAAPAAGEV